MLDKVGGLLLMPGTQMATLQQVADFYKVDNETIKFMVLKHKDELTGDGLAFYPKGEIIDLLKVDNLPLKTYKGKTVITFTEGEELVIPNRGLRLLPKRATLRVGMLLRDSEVAKEVRTQLLNIEGNASEEVKMLDITEEQMLQLESKSSDCW